jgi:hypothetical protein
MVCIPKKYRDSTVRRSRGPPTMICVILRSLGSFSISPSLEQPYDPIRSRHRFDAIKKGGDLLGHLEVGYIEHTTDFEKRFADYFCGGQSMVPGGRPIGPQHI